MPKKGEVTLQITVTQELKTDVDDLAMATRQKVSDMLRPMIQQLVELNMPRIKVFRDNAATPIVLPYPPVKSKSKAKSSKKETKAKETPADESAGVENGEE